LKKGFVASGTHTFHNTKTVRKRMSDFEFCLSVVDLRTLTALALLYAPSLARRRGGVRAAGVAR
jgi:hypothetical protein